MKELMRVLGFVAGIIVGAVILAIMGLVVAVILLIKFVKWTIKTFMKFNEKLRAFWAMVGRVGRAIKEWFVKQLDRNKKALDKVKKAVGLISTAYGNFKKKIQDLGAAFRDKLNPYIETTKTILNSIKETWNTVKGAWGKITGKKQLGGVLGSGVTLVGERGPELMVGNRIIPANETRSRLRNGGGQSIQIVNNYNNTTVNPEVVASSIAFQLNSLGI